MSSTEQGSVEPRAAITERKGNSCSLCPPQPSTPQLPGFRMGSSQKVLGIEATGLDAEAVLLSDNKQYGQG